jgi:bifunctional DNA-binding transcriptional regulator/antitoxin component of YhaV-PrlF toxin-antitoxin module
MQDNVKRTSWTLTVEEDPDTGDGILTFPEDFLEQSGWKEGDTIVWKDNGNGSFSLTKKSTNQIKFYNSDRPENFYAVINLDGLIDPNIIKANIDDLHDKYPESSKSNLKCWHTYEAIRHPGFDELIKVIEEYSEEIALKIDRTARDYYAKVVQAWAGFYRKLEFAEHHNHWPFPLVAVYYADVEESSSLVLSTGSNPEELKPMANDLILFPGHIMHRVTPVLENKKRYVFATNILLLDPIMLNAIKDIR